MMDSLESLYLSQLMNATTQNTQAASGSESTTDTAFADLLANLSNDLSTANSSQQYLFSGLMDGSIEVTNSQQLVSALLGTLGQEEEDAASGLFQFDSSLLSQNTISSLYQLGLSSNDEWVQKLVDTLIGTSSGSDDLYYDYYQSMAALAETQKNLLEE